MARELSKEIKKRFIRAVEALAAENYPKTKEAEVIRSVGMAPMNYYKMRGMEGRYPTLDNCALLCEKYGISAAWLIVAQGPMKSRGKTRAQDPLEMLKTATKELEMQLRGKPK